MKKMKKCKKYIYKYSTKFQLIFISIMKEIKKYIYKICTYQYQFLIIKMVNSPFTMSHMHVYDKIASDNRLAATYCAWFIEILIIHDRN